MKLEDNKSLEECGIKDGSQLYFEEVKADGFYIFIQDAGSQIENMINIKSNSSVLDIADAAIKLYHEGGDMRINKLMCEDRGSLSEYGVKTGFAHYCVLHILGTTIGIVIGIYRT